MATAWALIAGGLWLGGNDLSPSRWPGLITAPPIDQVVAQHAPDHRSGARAPRHHATARPRPAVPAESVTSLPTPAPRHAAPAPRPAHHPERPAAGPEPAPAPSVQKKDPVIIPPAQTPATAIPAPGAGPVTGPVPVAPPLLLAIRRVALTGPANNAEILVDLSLAHPAAGTSTDLQMHVRVTDAAPQLASFLGGPAALTGTIDVVADAAGNPQLRLNLQVVPAAPQLTDALSGPATTQPDGLSNAMQIAVPLGGVQAGDGDGHSDDGDGDTPGAPAGSSQLVLALPPTAGDAPPSDPSMASVSASPTTDPSSGSALPGAVTVAVSVTTAPPPDAPAPTPDVAPAPPADAAPADAAPAPAGDPAPGS